MSHIYRVGIINNGKVIHVQFVCKDINELTTKLIKKYDDINKVLYINQIEETCVSIQLPFIEKHKL